MQLAYDFSSHDFSTHKLQRKFNPDTFRTISKRTFSDIRPVSGVCAIPRLTGRISTGRCRRGRTRCTGVATAGSVGTVTRVKSRKTPVGFVPEVTLRPDCKTHHTLLQRRLSAR